MHQKTRFELYEILSKYFNSGELRTLAYDLNVDYENLAGETSSSKIRSLVEYADRRGRLDDLVGYVRKLRPDAWTKQDTDFESPININIGNVGPGAAIGTGASIRAENITGQDIIISEQFQKQKVDFRKNLQELQQLVGAILKSRDFHGKQYLLNKGGMRA